MPAPSPALWVLAVATVVTPGLAHPAGDKSAIETVWTLERTYWEATVAQDDPAYQALWHKDFLGWPCGEESPVTGSPPPMTPDAVKRSYAMDKRAATMASGVVSTFYHVRERDEHPDGRIEIIDYNVTHNWVPTGRGWKILSGMCKSPVQ